MFLDAPEISTLEAEFISSPPCLLMELIEAKKYKKKCCKKYKKGKRCKRCPGRLK